MSWRTRGWSGAHSRGSTLRGHTGALLSASWSGDGTRVVTASIDGTARIWASTSDPTSFLRSRIRARTRLCLDADFLQDTLGMSAAEAEHNARTCERCVPVFFERLGNAPNSERRAYVDAWKVYERCLGTPVEVPGASEK